MKIVRRDLVPDGPGSVKMVPEEADHLKVLREAASGGRNPERVKLKLEIKVDTIEYDKEGSALRIQGKNVPENEHVKMVAFPTLEIESHRPFVLRKILSSLNFWIHYGKATVVLRYKQWHDPSASADLGEVLIQEGLAHIFLVSKRHSLREVLDAPNVMNMIKDTKAAQEVQALKEFFSMLSNVRILIVHTNGPKHVEVAHERLAVQTLLITDELFRSSDIDTWQKCANLVKSIKDSGGTAYIFSSMHVSGEQLAQLTGIAAILRFPLPDLEDIEM